MVEHKYNYIEILLNLYILNKGYIILLISISIYCLLDILLTNNITIKNYTKLLINNIEYCQKEILLNSYIAKKNYLILPDKNILNSNIIILLKRNITLKEYRENLFKKNKFQIPISKKIIVLFSNLIYFCNNALKVSIDNAFSRYIHKLILSNVFTLSNTNYRIMYDIFISSINFNKLRILINSNIERIKRIWVFFRVNQNTCQNINFKKINCLKKYNFGYSC